MPAKKERETAPALSPMQRKAALADHPPVPANCVVTGGTGFVGQRLVEMLVERGAKRVVSFDIVPKERVRGAWDHPAIEYVVGDIADPVAVENAIKGADCVWHLAAAVGPFHPQNIYKRINYGGTVNVIAACKKHGVSKLVMSTSPSTRFKGNIFSPPNIDGLTEEEMPKLPMKSYMQPYAATKAMAEVAVTEAVSDTFFTINVAPHQVYGPRDNLFMPNTMEAAGTGKLRIFADGKNRVCFTHVDNYCHALIIAERQLYKGSPVLGQFYIATDGDTHPEPDAYAILWKELDLAVRGLGFTPLTEKFRLPFWLLYCIALLCEVFGWMIGKVFKLNVFNVFMLTINRWFKIGKIEKDLGYKPIIGFKEGWADTIEWFRLNWLPEFKAAQAEAKKKGFLANWLGIATGSQAKIDIQAKTAAKK